MAIKDRFDRLVSYFDTDDASEAEVTKEASQLRPMQPQQQSSHVNQQQISRQEREQQSQIHSKTVAQEEDRRRNTPLRSDVSIPNTGGTTIALKFPRKYEDAQEIVDLLIENECVLIDFQYMLEAQARRCLDFIDGASRVLYGSLQKVGSSMYLLTPKDVIVDTEEMNLSNASQEVSFDYDMKRR